MDASKPDMTYTTLGATGLEVSELCLGCMNFGSEAEWMMNDREASVDLIHEALDHGINFLDTADVYSRGESEEIVGEAVASANRDELVLATKVYDDMHEGPNGQGLSRKHVLDQVEDSLDRLGTDYVDLYRIHRWDESTPVEETLSALDHLVETGRVRYIGASTMSGYRFTKALYESDLNDYERFTCMQPEYNAVDRHEEANLLPMCAGESVGVIPWSPLAGGFLTGKYERDAEPDSNTRAAGDDYTRQRFTDGELGRPRRDSRRRRRPRRDPSAGEPGVATARGRRRRPHRRTTLAGAVSGERPRRRSRADRRGGRAHRGAHHSALAGAREGLNPPPGRRLASCDTPTEIIHNRSSTRHRKYEEVLRQRMPL